MTCEICEQVKVPVIVVGCKEDVRNENQKVSLEQVMSPIVKQCPEVTTCIECSALEEIKVLFTGALFCLSSFSLLIFFFSLCWLSSSVVHPCQIFYYILGSTIHLLLSL
jgi:hypothetical protein